jgi:hypothetical protein
MVVTATASTQPQRPNADTAPDQAPLRLWATEQASATRRFAPERLRRYLARGSADVLGWLEPTDALITRVLADLQTQSGHRGGVGEIGVHHGKLFILLYLVLHVGERAFCIDVFEAQELNPDGSGHGDEPTLRRNLLAHAGSLADIEMLRGNSADMSAGQILAATGPVRLFSVDGGHSAELAYNDLCLADATLAPHGVILLDDYFEREWPGVSDGTQQFLRERRPDLVPFAIGLNKVYFCRPPLAQHYGEAVRATCADLFLRRAAFLGAPVDIYEDGRNRLQARVAAIPLWLAIRTTPLGHALRRVWHLVRR